jgi:asparagine synthase (glutamine-hydrolysing)
MLPEDVTWRAKTPIEFGSGSCALREFAINSVSDNEFETAKTRAAAEDGILLRDKEQFFYYKIYRTVLLPPSQQAGGAKRCGSCGGPVERPEQKYCRICGAYPC